MNSSDWPSFGMPSGEGKSDEDLCLGHFGFEHLADRFNWLGGGCSFGGDQPELASVVCLLCVPQYPGTLGDIAPPRKTLRGLVFRVIGFVFGRRLGKRNVQIFQRAGWRMARGIWVPGCSSAFDSGHSFAVFLGWKTVPIQIMSE